MSGFRAYEFLTGFTTPDQPGLDGDEVDFTIANNQSSAANVTGVSFASASVKAVRVLFFIHRQDATPAQADEVGELYIRYRSVQNDWQVTTVSYGDDAGVTFSMTGTTTGQLQYTSTNYTGGSYAGTSTFRWSLKSTIEV